MMWHMLGKSNEERKIVTGRRYVNEKENENENVKENGTARVNDNRNENGKRSGDESVGRNVKDGRGKENGWGYPTLILSFSLRLKKFILCTLTCLILFSALLIFLMLMANTPLHVAASLNSVEVVKFLLNFATVDLEAKNIILECTMETVSVTMEI
ncbi:putative ankyrin repeat-containing domain-containing protein [Helianthus debilis subsp. tardiflorus]